jgi:hypothetical protein
MPRVLENDEDAVGYPCVLIVGLPKIPHSNRFLLPRSTLLIPSHRFIRRVHCLIGLLVVG